ncbi:MAG: hypothetical protein ACI9X0_003064, partial [Kiritimatiellia bacterium]
AAADTIDIAAMISMHKVDIIFIIDALA